MSSDDTRGITSEASDVIPELVDTDIQRSKREKTELLVDRQSIHFNVEMSDLQKSFAKSKLAKVPPEVPMEEPNIPEDAWESSSATSSVSSSGTAVPSPTRQLFARAGRSVTSQLSCLSWIKSYFTQFTYL